jgi:hypothetical protein
MSSADSWLTTTLRDAAVAAVVAINGTLPSGWMWRYDAAEAVAAEAARGRAA